MNSKEIHDIILHCPYNFTEEDVPDPTIRIDTLPFTPIYTMWMTPAMMWIVEWNTEPPEALRHDPKIVDSFGLTCAMYWIINCKSDIPSYMIHDPTIQDNNGYTCAMWWISIHKTIPPNYLLHNPKLRGPIIHPNRRLTCSMLWIMLNLGEVPKCLRVYAD